MKTLWADTDPRLEAVMLEGIRRMSGAERLARVFSLREAALSLARVRITERHGTISEREMRLRLASLWVDRETMVKVFGWDPEVQGY